MSKSPQLFTQIAVGGVLVASAAGALAWVISTGDPWPGSGREKPAITGSLSVTEGPPRDVWPSLVHFVHRCADLKGTVSATAGAYRLPDNDPVLPGARQITAAFVCEFKTGGTVTFDRRRSVAQTLALFQNAAR